MMAFQPSQQHRHLARLRADSFVLLDEIREAVVTATTDLQEAVTALKAEHATFLAHLADRLSGVVTASDVESAVTDINAQIAALQAADPEAASAGPVTAATPDAGGSASPTGGATPATAGASSQPVDGSTPADPGTGTVTPDAQPPA